MLASWVAQGTALGRRQTAQAGRRESLAQGQAAAQRRRPAAAGPGGVCRRQRARRDPPGLVRQFRSPLATVDPSGKLKAEGFGEAAVSATFMRRSDTVRVLIPQPLPTPFPKIAPNNKIDELVFAKLQKLGFPPSDLCSDEAFLRRAYLDVIGCLPKPEEARAFLADPDPAKRAKLIDRLLERDEYADFWALKWGDLLRIKSEYPGAGLAARRADVLPLGPRQHRGEQAVRPVRARADHRQRERLPGRPGQLLSRGPEAGTPDLCRGHGRAVPGSPARLCPLPRAPHGELGPGRRPGDGGLLQQGGHQGDARVEGRDRLLQSVRRRVPPEAEGLRQSEVPRRRSPRHPARSGPAAEIRRVAHRAAESVVCQGHGESGVVLAVGTRDRPRAGRFPLDEPAQQPGAVGLPDAGVRR